MTAVASSRAVRDFEGRWIDDGYHFIGAGADAGWRPVPGWGEDGWDLGDWPYVVVLFRDRIEPTGQPGDSDRIRSYVYERAVYVEGDITIETYLSEADRQTATDETAAFYWRHCQTEATVGEELWGALMAAGEGALLPARFRGPHRTRKEQQ